MSVKLSVARSHLLDFIADSIKDDVIDVIDEFFFDVKDKEIDFLPLDLFKLELFFSITGNEYEEMISLGTINFILKDIVEDNDLLIELLGSTYLVWGPHLNDCPEGKIMFHLEMK